MSKKNKHNQLRIKKFLENKLKKNKKQVANNSMKNSKL